MNGKKPHELRLLNLVPPKGRINSAQIAMASSFHQTDFAFGLERFKVKTHAYAFPISLPIGSIRFGLWTLVPAHLGTQRCLLLCVYHRLSKHPQKRCVSCANSYYIHLHVWENYAK